MCLDKVLLNGIKDGDEVIFKGYKLFRESENSLTNWNTGKIEYEYDKWYEAKLDGDKWVGGYVKITYTSGFHIFLTKAEAMEYTKSCPEWINQVEFKNIVGFGYENNVLVVLARNMKIVKDELRMSDIKPGEKFSIGSYSNPINEMLQNNLFELRFNGYLQKYAYMDVVTKNLHATNDNSVVVRR
jgi:hypothetical protein